MVIPSSHSVGNYHGGTSVSTGAFIDDRSPEVTLTDYFLIIMLLS